MQCSREWGYCPVKSERKVRDNEHPLPGSEGEAFPASGVHEGTRKTAHFADFFLPPLSTCGRSSGTSIADSLMQEDHTLESFGVPNNVRLQVKWQLHSWTYWGHLMLEVKIILPFLLWQISGDTLGGVFCHNIYFFLISLQVIHSLKSIHPFQSCITGIFAVEENPVLSLLKVSSCHCWGGEVLQIHVRCSQRAQASSRSQFNSRFPERTQKGLLSHREAASKGSPHPLQCSSFSVWLMCYRRASLDHKWDA